MAKILGLDIPSGLEDLFQKALTSRVLGGVLSLMRHRPGVSQQTKYIITGYSLFQKWEYIWDEFLPLRREAWQNYWASLPFGSHEGENGWPGSGYSAFIYVNAPRYQSGLDLLLDPPNVLGTELIPNANFPLNLTGWDFSSSFSAYEWQSPGVVAFAPNSEDFDNVDITMDSSTFTPSEGEFHCEVKYLIPPGNIARDFRLTFIDEVDSFEVVDWGDVDLIDDGEWHIVGHDFAIDAETTTPSFVRAMFSVQDSTDDVFIDYISLKKYI